MFDGVPKANKVRLNAKLMGQKVRASCLKTQMLARVGDGVVRNIDSLHRPECGPGHFEKKSVGATDLK